MESSKKNEDEFWMHYYNDDKIVNRGDELHLNISRTRNGKIVTDEIWMQTINHMITILGINSRTVLLELCCGNGLVLGELAAICNKAYGVDYSKILLEQFKRNYNLKNTQLICSDVKEFVIEKDKYDIIIIYFSLQHFNERESFLLIKKCIDSISSKGKIFIGDVPDLEKKWKYINKDDYHKDYFERLVNYMPKIGNWFQKEYFLAMNSCFEEASFQILEQPDYQINSDYRFDVLITKK